MGAVDEEAAQLGVACFGDGELFVALAGLVAAGDESEVGSDVAGAGEALGVFEGENKAEGGDGADAGNLLEALGDGVLGLAQGFQLLFKCFDLAVEVFEAQEQGFDEGTVGGFELKAGFFGEGVGFDAGGQEDAETFKQATGGVDEVDAGAHKGFADFEGDEGALSVFGAVLDGRKELGISASESCKHASVLLVGFVVGGGNGTELAGVGDDDGMSPFGKESADPRGMGASFDDNPGFGETRGKGG